MEYTLQQEQEQEQEKEKEKGQGKEQGQGLDSDDSAELSDVDDGTHLPDKFRKIQKKLADSVGHKIRNVYASGLYGTDELQSVKLARLNAESMEYVPEDVEYSDLDSDSNRED